MRPAAEVLLASAGSGKTFQLTLRYAGLVLRGVPVKEILAATFTRKAAGEIQSRVLERLAGGAEGLADLEDLRKFLKDPNLTSEDCAKALITLVADLPHMKIKTLDSWFAQLGKAFAPDLGLEANWTILEQVEDDEILVRSVEALLAGLEPSQRGVLLNDLQKGGNKAGVISALVRSIQLGRSRQRWAELYAWGTLEVPDPPSEQEWQAVLADAEGWELPLTKKGTPHKKWVDARNQLLADLADGHWQSAVDSTLFQRSIDGEPFNSIEFPEHLKEPFKVIRQRLAHEVLTVIHNQNLAMAEVLTRFDFIHRQLQREQHGLRFDDLAGLLAASASGEHPFDLSYRLDAQLNHALLDEYQDTNALQHASLDKNLINLASFKEDDQSVIVVGDLKQSIYGFRQAEPRLLRGLGDRLGVKPIDLKENWRSSPVVLSAVNQVFRNISAAAPFQAPDKPYLREAAEEWQADFLDHHPCKDNESLLGSVRIWQAPEGDGESKDELLKFAAQHVADLHDQAPKAVIAVLVRSKSFGRQMIARLALKGVAAVGDGGHLITDCELVRAILALLYLVDHPGDGHALGMVWGSSLVAALGLQPTDDPAEMILAGNKVAHDVRTQILSIGLGPWMATLGGSLKDLNAFETQRLNALVTAAHGWTDRIELRLSTFFDHALTMKVGVESDALVRVVTIHAAKGLEYDAVVLPELMGLMNRAPKVVSSRPDAYGKIESMCLYQGNKIQALSPELKELHEIEAKAQMQDTLCTLYVALTRAKRSIDLILPAEKPTKWNNLTFAGILRSTFDISSGLGTGLVYTHPESQDVWFEDLDERPASPNVVSEQPLVLRPDGPLRSVTMHSPSAAEGGTSKCAADWLDTISAGAADRGNLAHEWLSGVEWLAEEQEGPSSQELEQFAARMGVSKAVVDDVQVLLAKSLQTPAIRDLLLRPDNCDNLQVWRERGFSVLLQSSVGGDELWNGSFDRVVLEQGADGAWKAATIIDYKSDQVRGEGVAVRAAHYRPQLEAYRRALAGLTGLPASSICMQLAFLAVGEVVELTDPA